MSEKSEHVIIGDGQYQAELMKWLCGRDWIHITNLICDGDQEVYNHIFEKAVPITKATMDAIYDASEDGRENLVMAIQVGQNVLINVLNRMLMDLGMHEIDSLIDELEGK